MYESYWQLTSRPFDAGSDPGSYYPCEAHQAALLKLRYAVESRSGGGLLTGAAGSGKTLVARLLADRLGETYTPVVHLVFPQLTTPELLALLADELAQTPGEPSRGSADESVRRIRQGVEENAAAGRHALVIIDEAHLIETNRTLEALRLLLNFEVDGRPALSLVLVGQPALVPMLERMPQLDERLAVKCLLRPLSVEETMSYVQYRLSAAGCTRPLFDAAALETIHRQSRGLPRRINRLCDLALLIGFAEERQVIGAKEIDAVSEELAGVSAD